MNIEQVVAEMPRVEGEYNYNAPFDAYGQGVEAQCQLLAEQGYRKVSSEDEISARILSLIIEYNNIPPEHKAEEDLAIWVGWRLHRWWLEAECEN